MSDADESEIQHVYPHFEGKEAPETTTFCGLEGGAQPLTDKPFCAKCHVSLLVALGHGYRVIGEDNHDLAHAVALERNATIAFLQHEMQANYDAWEDGVDPSGQERGIALSNAWNDIANGKHHQEDQ